ncbi:MAG: c-type cytochrome [Sandaracinaceae bacterium]
MRPPLGLLCLLLVACDGAAPTPPVPTTSVEPEPPAPIGDAARGRALLVRFECSRCHAGAGPPAAAERDCVGCHRDVRAGRVEAPPEILAGWRASLHSLPDAPDLAGASRLDAAWIAEYLQRPVDLRPHLEATMPRLPLDARDARDVASALAPPRAPSATGGDPARGREAVAARPCGQCHTLGGEPLPTRGAAGVGGEAFARARRLAPDLAFAAARMPATLVDWLVDPASLHPRTEMPPTDLSAAEARDVAAYLRASTEIDVRRPLPPRLPLLSREVTWEEVDAALFHDTCWHCHSDPGYAIGDGGPGNTGGLNFEGRGLDLASYEALRSGALFEGRRRSVFREVTLPGGETLPLVVASLRARQLEEAGLPSGDVLGMPLGLPSVSPEAIQLLETWIAQGRRR